MKKVILYLPALFLITFFTACNEDLEIWDSETLEYSGRYLVNVQDDAGVDTDITHREFNVYNTSANVANEFWLNLTHDDADFIDVKFKAMVNGTSEAFSSKSMDFASVAENITAITKPSTPPTGLGEVLVEDQAYIKAGVVEGKILPLAATTIGGNQADSVYVKVLFYSGSVSFESYELPVALREDPEVEEYAWRQGTLTHDATLDETFIFAGHRYTGMPEDDYH